MKRHTPTPTLIALAALLALLFWQSSRPGEKPVPLSGSQPANANPTADPFSAFDAALSARDAATTEAGERMNNPELVELAKERAATMRRLIVDDPERALELALGWDEVEKLPAALRAHVEQPFNTVADWHALPVCGAAGPGVPEMVYVLEFGESNYAASPVGRAGHIGSKREVPLSGITLGDVAAVRELPLELLTGADATALSARPIANPHPAHCFASGEVLPTEGGSVALLGGQRVLFADEETAVDFGERLAELNDAPGPHSGARVVFELADGAPGEGFDWGAAGELVEYQASAWAETPKDVFFIRVDFSDYPGEATTQATLASSLATTSANISEQSYGKTSLNSTVSAATIRMPNSAASYLPGSTTDLYNDAMSAYEAIHGATSLDSYDIVGVHFTDIGITSNGFAFAGLAGGSRQWLQDTTNPNVVIHEFGHNYGIGHASSWGTTDGSVVGTGTSTEYGDPFDIMGGGPDPEGHFHMQAKSKVNWIETTQWVDADAAGSGTYRIYPIDNDTTTGTYRGLRAEKAADEYYWIGYRTAIPGNAYLPNGGYMVWQRPGFSRSWLLDTTPDSAPGKEDAALAVGTTYSDASAGVHLTPVATGGSGADSWIDVTVNLGTFPGNNAPTVSITGPSTADARTPVSFTASASDPDADTLAYSWDFGDGAVSPNTASVSKTWLSGGSYTVTLTVSDMKGGVATDTLSVAVSDPLGTWTQRTSGTTDPLSDIATDGTTLVATSNNSSSTDVLTSTDGSTWSSVNIGLNVALYGIAHDGSQFIAVGEEYDFGPGAWLGVIYTSADGATWAQQHHSGVRLLDIATGGGNYVAVGRTGAAWRSTDSMTWSPVSPGTSEDLDAVAYGGSGFVIASSETGGGPVIALTSPDGSGWTDRASGVGTAGWQGFYDIEYCNDRFLASGWFSKIRHSTDGGQSFATTRSTTEQIAAFAYGNGVYLAAGIDKDNGDAAINLISTDGESWTALATVAQPLRKAAVFFDDTFITVGDTGSIRQSAPFTAPPAGGFAGWLATNFPGGSSATDDPDGDGIPNAAEYASGTDPNQASDATPAAVGTSGGFTTLTVAKDPAATDATYTVEICDDLSSWTTAGTTVLSDTATELVVRADSATDKRTFLRATYTVPD